jgi:hypothetical protein
LTLLLARLRLSVALRFDVSPVIGSILSIQLDPYFASPIIPKSACDLCDAHWISNPGSGSLFPSIFCCAQTRDGRHGSWWQFRLLAPIALEIRNKVQRGCGATADSAFRFSQSLETAVHYADTLLPDPPDRAMKPRQCRTCGAFAVLPPDTMDLATSVSCRECGSAAGSWRALEISSSTDGGESTDSVRRRPSSDLRAQHRARTLLGARIEFNNGSSTVDCTVRDLSATGAKVLLSPHVAIPDEFDLAIPQGQRRHRARIIWRNAQSCGVRFIAATLAPNAYEGAETSF